MYSYMDYREITVNNAKLRCYADSNVERYIVQPNQFYKKGWNVVNVKPNRGGYLSININGKLYRLHRIIYKAFNPDFDIDDTQRDNSIDHINGIKTDNRIENLRPVTNSQNGMNRCASKNNRCGEKCIYPWYDKKKGDSWFWLIQIRVNGKTYTKKFKGGDGKIPDILPPVPQHVIDKRNEMIEALHGDYARV